MRFSARLAVGVLPFFYAVLVAGAVPATPTTGTPSTSAGGTLAFSAEGDIYTIHLDGTGQTRLTDDPAEDFDPAWSPDGSMIAFRSQRDGNDEIYVMNADGSDQRNLTNEPAEDWSPDWSPDGKSIAYATFAYGGTFRGGAYTDIAVIPVEGGEPTRLTEAHGEYPDWSPDGTQIAFTSGRAGSYDIWVMNADGTNQHPLTDNPAYESSPAWSPDGRSVIFDAEWGEDRDHESGIGFEFDIWVIDVDGADLRQVTNDPTSEDRFPAWGADGRIAFNRNGELRVMSGDGSQPEPLPGSPHGQFPAWRPALPADAEPTG
jgi:Tol biopolymer transport system component